MTDSALSSELGARFAPRSWQIEHCPPVAQPNSFASFAHDAIRAASLENRVAVRTEPMWKQLSFRPAVRFRLWGKGAGIRGPKNSHLSDGGSETAGRIEELGSSRGCIIGPFEQVAEVCR